MRVLKLQSHEGGKETVFEDIDDVVEHLGELFPGEKLIITAAEMSREEFDDLEEVD